MPDGKWPIRDWSLAMCCWPLRRRRWWPAGVTRPVPRIKSPLHHFNACEPKSELPEQDDLTEGNKGNEAGNHDGSNFKFPSFNLRSLRFLLFHFLFLIVDMLQLPAGPHPLASKPHLHSIISRA